LFASLLLNGEQSQASEEINSRENISDLAAGKNGEKES
jgi:hypothetical protein